MFSESVWYKQDWQGTKWRREEEVLSLSFAFNRFLSLESPVKATIILQHKGLWVYPLNQHLKSTSIQLNMLQSWGLLDDHFYTYKLIYLMA